MLINGAVIFNMTCLAYLLEKLQATTDGTNSLLDQSAIMVVSDAAQGITHSNWDMPFLVAGKGGGKLKTDLHYRATNDRGAAPNTSDVLLSLLKVYDPTATEVGSAEGYSNTELSQIKLG